MANAVFWVLTDFLSLCKTLNKVPSRRYKVRQTKTLILAKKGEVKEEYEI
jgi:cytochrome c biogenesis protein ResB